MWTPVGVWWPERGPIGVLAAEKCDCEPWGSLTTGRVGGMPTYEPTGEKAFSRATLAKDDRRLGAMLPA